MVAAKASNVLVAVGAVKKVITNQVRQTAMVKMMIPIFNPCCWMSGKYSLSGVIRKIMSTAAAMVTAEL